MLLALQYELNEDGSATVRTSCDQASWTISLHDGVEGLVDLAETAWMLARGQNLAYAKGDGLELLYWSDGQRKYCWEFLRQNWVDLEIELCESSTGFQGDKSEEFPEEPLLRGACSVSQFAHVVLQELERNLLRFGFVGFRALHRYHQFPISYLFRLRDYLQEQAAGSPPLRPRAPGQSCLADEVDYLHELMGSAPSPVISAPLRFEEGDLSIRYRLRDAGWADAWVWAGGAEVHFVPGYLSHCLAELSHAAVRLIRAEEPRYPDEGEWPEVVWQGEPEQLRWEFSGREADQVDIRIYYSGNALVGSGGSWAIPAVERMVLATCTQRRTFAWLVLQELEQVLLHHGLLGYRESWIGSEFPLSDYLKLRSLLTAPNGPAGSDLAGGLDYERALLAELVRRASSE